MATATTTRPDAPATRDGVRPYKLTVRQFLKMIEAGVFPEAARVELLAGLLAEPTTKHSPHNFAVGRLGDALRALVGPDWMVNEEKSVALGLYWRPEPDIAVVRVDLQGQAPGTIAANTVLP